ncbi:MAG: hypothetical protein WBF17_06325, partial [Phycisphaerae bacterium]
PREHKTREGRVRKDPYDGDDSGHANRWLYWQTKTIVDGPAAWEMTVALMQEAPADECTVNVTPRRLQQLEPKDGQTFSWTNKAADGKVVQKGKVTADKWGLLTLEKVAVTKGGNRLGIGEMTNDE